MGSQTRPGKTEAEVDRAGAPRSAGSLPWLARGCAALATLIGLLALLGWITGTLDLERGLPGLDAAIKVNTAIGLIAGGLAWLTPRRLGTVLAAFMGVLSLLVLIEYAAGVDLGIDELLFADSAARGYPGRPSIMTATTLLVLAIAIVLVHVRRTSWAQLAALVALPGAALTVLGYAYDVRSFANYHPATTVALPTAVGVILLSAATLAVVDDGVLTWIVRGPDAAAALLRRLLPLALLGLPVIGWVCLYAQRHGWIADRATGTALFVELCALALGVFAWVVARRIARIDRTRAAALDELVELKDDLERKVAVRAEQIQRSGGQIAVLEDRQRIAADLHDVVIQRLFAAGMYLQGATAIPGDPAVAERIGTAVEAMDGAIRDLRHSIFELGGHGVPRTDALTAIDSLCREATRVLGFTPDVVVDDPDGASDPLREDILAVLREALSNVARHAGASAAAVELRVIDDVLVLVVADDGQGMTELPHRSGTRNLLERARRRGGDCVWTNVIPHGTRMTWRVPVPDPTLPDVRQAR